MPNTDFDFLAGSWTSVQRRLERVLSDCDDWYEFSATLDTSVHLDGNATFDVLRSPERDLEGLTLRLYSPDEQVWRIWWASPATGGRLDVPVVGRFDGSIGTFECDDSFEGRPIRVRYRWSDVGTEHPRWEQAFSPDSGQTWEVNWRAVFTRRVAA
ncbi:MAG TPA: hypothetical protein VH561_13335 [Micromonosporaceae bacterium]|jgi:hypothetical protein